MELSTEEMLNFLLDCMLIKVNASSEAGGLESNYYQWEPPFEIPGSAIGFNFRVFCLPFENFILEFCQKSKTDVASLPSQLSN